MDQRILIVVEPTPGALSPTTGALAAMARSLTEHGAGSIAAGLAGPAGVLAVAEHLLSQGVPEVFIMEHPALADTGAAAYARAIEAICRAATAGVVLLARTPLVETAAPMLAQRLGAGIVTNCVDLRFDASGALEATCPLYGGNVMGVYQFDRGAPAVVTVGDLTPGPFPEKEGGKSGRERDEKGKVVRVPVPDLDGYQPRVKLIARSSTAGERLESARVIVAAGGGVAEQRHYEMIKEIARKTGGVTAASRPVIVRGWATPSQKVGLTGARVAPNVYLAIGISGASQHMAGCARARAIVAVNKDPRAPIFHYARFGVVGDAGEFVEALLQELATKDTNVTKQS